MLYKSQFSQLLLFNSFIYSQWINTFATKLKSYKQYTDGYFVDTSRGSDHICPFWKGSMYPASNKICPRVCKTSLEGKKNKTNLDLLAWQDIKTCGHSTCKWNRFKARVHILNQFTVSKLFCAQHVENNHNTKLHPKLHCRYTHSSNIVNNHN